MSKTLTVKARNAVEAEAEARRILAERGDASEPVHPVESPSFDVTRPEYHLWQFMLVEPEVRTIDITPTWTAILPVLLGVLQNPEAPAAAHREVEGELRRMAKFADEYVAIVAPNAEALQPRLGDPDQKES
jgi:hypothetical protein